MYFEIKVRKWVELSSGPLRISFGCGPQHAVYLENKLSLNIKFFFLTLHSSVLSLKSSSLKKQSCGLMKIFTIGLTRRLREREVLRKESHTQSSFLKLYGVVLPCVFCVE